MTSRRTSWSGIVTVLVLASACSAVRQGAPSGPPALAVVEDNLVQGLTSAIYTNEDKGRYTYLSFPQVPGAQEWTDAMRAGLAPRLHEFNRMTVAETKPPLPELQVSWDLVASSPEAIGARLLTAQLGTNDTFEGKAETTWWDPVAKETHAAQNLIDQTQGPAFFARLRAAAQADPRVDMKKFSKQLDGEWESFDSVAFTTTADLWIEFDRLQVSDVDEPLGIAVNPDGLLSKFGIRARAAAIKPRDPRLGGKESAPAEPSLGSIPTADVVDCDVEKCAALTFDDGPVSGTKDLLDTLAKEQAPATFFVVGKNIAEHPELVQRMVSDGHVVGNHSTDHPQLTRLNAAAIRKEIKETNAQIELVTGLDTHLLRPPYGATNDTVKKVAADLGMAQIMWDVDPDDWKDRDKATVTRRVLDHTHRGSIVLAHDIYPSTRDAVPGIIHGLRSRGFTLVTIPQLLGAELDPGRVYRSR